MFKIQEPKENSGQDARAPGPALPGESSDAELVGETNRLIIMP